MLRSLAVVGVMSMCGVALLLGAGPKREVDGLASQPSGETKAKVLQSNQSNRSVVVESATVSGSAVKNVRIRNSGSKSVDVRGFGVSKVGGSRLELVQGSFELAAGEVALIITSSDFDVNEEARSRLYTNMYRAVGGDGSVVSLSTETFRLVDDTGFVLGGGNPEIMTVQGNCCNHLNCCVSPSSESECCGAANICLSFPKFHQTPFLLLCDPNNCDSCSPCTDCP